MADVRKSRRVGKAHTLPTAPAYTFGGRNEKPANDPGPGPGEYGPSMEFSQKGAGFGTSTRYSGSGPSVPGPNDYSPSVSAVRKSSASFSFGGKQKGADTSRTPGPGAYEPSSSGDVVKPKMPAYSLQSRWAPTKDKDLKPSPGDYDPKLVTKAPAASIKFRHTTGSPETSPGPVYDVNSAQEALTAKPGKTFGASRPSATAANGVPAANAYMYDVSPVKSQRPAFSIGKEPRGVLRDNGVPGPATYLRGPIVQHQAGHSPLSGYPSQPAHVMPGKYYESRKEMVPGPGAYDPTERNASVRRSAPAYSLAGGYKHDKRERVPGPGAYDPERATNITHPSDVQVSLHTRPTDYPDKERRPAPGEYDPKRPCSCDNGVTLKFRHSTQTLNDTPAPHDYADKDFVSIYKGTGALRKGYSFGVKPKPQARDATPGPIYQVGCSTLGIAANSEPLNAAEAQRVAVL